MDGNASTPMTHFGPCPCSHGYYAFSGSFYSYISLYIIFSRLIVSFFIIIYLLPSNKGNKTTTTKKKYISIQCVYPSSNAGGDVSEARKGEATILFVGESSLPYNNTLSQMLMRASVSGAAALCCGRTVLLGAEWSTATVPSLSTSPALRCGAGPTNSMSLRCARRTYYHAFADDFVPADGPQPSRFQSSAVPSIRQRLHKLFALGPLFGERRVVCTLGFQEAARCHTGGGASHTPVRLLGQANRDELHQQQRHRSASCLGIREMVARKPQIRSCLARFFDTPEENIVLGSLQQTKEMMLFRVGLPDSPRLADGPGAGSPPSSPQHLPSPQARYTDSAAEAPHEVPVIREEQNNNDDAEESRQDVLQRPALVAHPHRAIARQPIAATVLLDVEFAPAEDMTPERALAYGALLQQYFYECSEAATAAQADGERGKDDEGAAERQRCRQCVQELRHLLGVAYCEVPLGPDSSDYAFLEWNGEAVTAADVEEVYSAWARATAAVKAVSENQQQTQKQYPPEENSTMTMMVPPFTPFTCIFSFFINIFIYHISSDQDSGLFAVIRRSGVSYFYPFFVILSFSISLFIYLFGVLFFCIRPFDFCHLPCTSISYISALFLFLHILHFEGELFPRSCWIAVNRYPLQFTPHTKYIYIYIYINRPIVIMPFIGVFFLVLLLGFVSYLIVGSLVRFNRGLRSCPAMLPHYQIWCRVLLVVVLVLTCGRIRLFRNVSGAGNSSFHFGQEYSGVQGGVVVLPNPPGAAGEHGEQHRFAAVMQEEDLDEFDMDAALNPAEIVVVY
eukprot:gene7435-5234_t